MNIISPPEFKAVLPAIIKRPCDFSLESAVTSLETQLGTIEAYNRIVASAAGLKEKIDSHKGRPASHCYAISKEG